MLDIQKMIISNDFSALIDSTQEQRELCGGNMAIYNKLKDYIFISYISEIIKEVFKNDFEVLNALRKDILSRPKEPIMSLIENEDKIEPIHCLLDDGYIESSVDLPH
jgi:hypothetical protein